MGGVPAVRAAYNYAEHLSEREKDYAGVGGSFGPIGGFPILEWRNLPLVGQVQSQYFAAKMS